MYYLNNTNKGLEIAVTPKNPVVSSTSKQEVKEYLNWILSLQTKTKLTLT